MKNLLLAFAFVLSTLAFGAGQWPGGKKVAFYLSFDDGCVSQIRNMFPLLTKYRIPATFYVCPGWPLFQEHLRDWSSADGYVHLGNHSYSHGNITNVVSFEEEIAKCNEAIRQATPSRPWPRTVAFGIPGTETVQKLVPGITPEEVKGVYTRHRLAERLPYHGYPVNCKTIPEMESYIDAIAATGTVGHLDFHGVGGDWLDPGMPYFEAMFRKLDEHRDEFWFTTTAELADYLAQRGGAAE